MQPEPSLFPILTRNIAVLETEIVAGHMPAGRVVAVVFAAAADIDVANPVRPFVLQAVVLTELEVAAADIAHPGFDLVGGLGQRLD